MSIDLFSPLLSMLGQIVQRTPLWVWGLLVALMVLGGIQWVGRTASWRRAMLTPAGMTAFAVYGLLSGFGAAGQAVPALLAWLTAAVAVATLALWMQPRPPVGTLYRADSHSFYLPGSAVPMALILGIFLTKYTVGIALAMHPEWAHASLFAAEISALYGAFNGIFLARAVRLWKLARPNSALTPAVQMPA